MLSGMAEQYVASDSRTGLEVAVTGEFPPAHEDRIRIARTCTLFTRLMSTILSTDSELLRFLKSTTPAKAPSTSISLVP